METAQQSISLSSQEVTGTVMPSRQLYTSPNCYFPTFRQPGSAGHLPCEFFKAALSHKIARVRTGRSLLPTQPKHNCFLVHIYHHSWSSWS